MLINIEIIGADLPKLFAFFSNKIEGRDSSPYDHTDGYNLNGKIESVYHNKR